MLGDRLRELIGERGWTQKAFAEKVGVEPATMNRIITGKQKPSERVLRRMSMILNVQFEYLTGEASEREHSTLDNPYLDEDYRNMVVSYILSVQKELGASIEKYLEIGGTKYKRNGLKWVKIEGNGWPERLRLSDTVKFIQGVDAFCDIYYVINYRGAEAKVPLREYNRWMARCIAQNDLLLQGAVGKSYDIRVWQGEGDVEEALEKNWERCGCKGNIASQNCQTS